MTAPRPARLQRSRAKGSRLPADAVVVTRGTRWGNPFPWKETGKPEAVRRFRAALLAGELPVSIDDVRRELAGKRLACWCAPGDACHADVLIEIANDLQPAR